MKSPLLIIFTLVNDRTQTYLHRLGVLDRFNEDQDLAAISFSDQIGLDGEAGSLPFDLVLLYDAAISRRAIYRLQQLATDRTVRIIFHRGLSSGEDRSRWEHQTKKLQQHLPNVQPPFLYEHASCGVIFDALTALAASRQNGDHPGYLNQLQKLVAKFDGHPRLDRKLRLLHQCLTPTGCARALDQEEVTAEILAGESAANRTNILNLIRDLAARPAIDSAEYQRSLSRVRDLLLRGEKL